MSSCVYTLQDNSELEKLSGKVLAGTAKSWNKPFTHITLRTGVFGRVDLLPYISILNLNIYYRFCGFQSSLLLIYFLCGPDTVRIRFVTIHFRDRRAAVSLRYRNRAEITVVMCELQPYPIWFSCRHKSYPVSIRFLGNCPPIPPLSHHFAGRRAVSQKPN